MTKLELARQCAEIGDIENSVNAYTLALKDNEHKDSLIDFECAMYILQFGGDYKLSFDTFIYLYNKGFYQKEIFDVMVTAFYAPNMSQQTEQYNSNLKHLNKYQFIFKKDFIDFDDLRIKFFPYDDEYFIPFYTNENRFGKKINFKYEEVTHNFFNNLDKPILAKDIYSQYELEYLNDNVRKSEWVGRENHIYLHYTDFSEFCSYLQVINFNDILKDKKFVFLFDKEISVYPIDFKEMFNIDYSKYPLRALNVREVKKLIWAVQISSSNGGDFFNEVLDSHPNILLIHSLMDETIKQLLDFKQRIKSQNTLLNVEEEINNTYFYVDMTKYLKNYRNDLTEKDILVAYALGQSAHTGSYDRASRIVPAVSFQPHFSSIKPEFKYDKRGTVSFSEEIEQKVFNYPFIKQFKYIKTFAPLRKITTSHASTIRYMKKQMLENPKQFIPNLYLTTRILTKNYMVSKNERMYKDSRIIRYEDGKLNPEATFRALAQFLDIPYTDTMKYCSRFGKIDAESDKTSVVGFDTRPVFRKYEDFVDPEEQYILEYMQQPAYRQYKYDFLYYDGKEMTEEKIDYLISKCNKHKEFYYDRMKEVLLNNEDYFEKVAHSIIEKVPEKYADKNSLNDNKSEIIEQIAQNYYEKQIHKLKEVLMTVDPNARVIDENGDDKVFMKLLEPIEELMVEPLYH